jgi:hypothetical protein
MQIVISGDECADVDQILRGCRLSGARAGHNAILALAALVGTDRSKIISASPHGPQHLVGFTVWL